MPTEIRTDQTDDRRPLVTLDENGCVDLSSFEAFLESVELSKWMRLRLEEGCAKDPYFLRDRDGMEAPEQVFIELWHHPEGGPRHDRVREWIGKACLKLIRAVKRDIDSSKMLQRVPTSFNLIRPLLSLVTAITPAACWETVADIAQTIGVPETDTDFAWVETASAFPHAALLAHYWQDLIESDSSAAVSIGHRGLCDNAKLAIRYLPAYLRAIPAEERPARAADRLYEIYSRNMSEARETLDLRLADGQWEDRQMRELIRKAAQQVLHLESPAPLESMAALLDEQLIKLRELKNLDLAIKSCMTTRDIDVLGNAILSVVGFFNASQLGALEQTAINLEMIVEMISDNEINVLGDDRALLKSFGETMSYRYEVMKRWLNESMVEAAEVRSKDMVKQRARLVPA